MGLHEIFHTTLVLANPTMTISSPPYPIPPHLSLLNPLTLSISSSFLSTWPTISQLFQKVSLWHCMLPQADYIPSLCVSPSLPPLIYLLLSHPPLLKLSASLYSSSILSIPLQYPTSLPLNMFTSQVSCRIYWIPVMFQVKYTKLVHIRERTCGLCLSWLESPH